MLADLNAPTFRIVNKKGLGPEETLQQSIVKAGYAPLHVYDVATITYFRLRRNHIIHHASTIAPRMQTFIANHCNPLNHYWLGTAEELDFSDLHVFTFQERECIDALKMLRIVLERVDAHVASLLDVGNLTDRVAEDLFGSKPQKLNADTVRSRAQALKKRIEGGYGLSPNQATLDSAARKHGAK